jgi:DNA-binding IclR family transcriptional regulator
MSTGQEILSLEAISHACGLPKSTTHRILSTLAMHNYVEPLEPPGLYRLGLRMAVAGSAAIRQRAPREDVHRVLENLRDQTEEATGMSVLDGRDVVVIDRVSSRHPLSYYIGVGTAMPAVCTAAGKVLLSGLSDEACTAIVGSDPVQQCTKRTVSSMADFRRGLLQVRELGYATDDEELAEGLRCLSVPVADAAGVVRYSVGILCAAARVNRQQLEAFLPAVRQAAATIQGHMQLLEAARR